MTKRLGDIPVGTEVWLKYDGTPRQFIVVHQGKPLNPSPSNYQEQDTGFKYDETCNGTWLLSTFVTDQTYEIPGHLYDYITIHNELVKIVLPRIPKELNSKIKTVNIPINNTTVSTKVFALTGGEMGIYVAKGYPTNQNKLSYFDDIYNDDSQSHTYRPYSDKYKVTNYSEGYPTRSPFTYDGLGGKNLGMFYRNRFVGYWDGNSRALNFRFALIFDPETYVDESDNILENNPPKTPSSITLPSTVYGGKSCSVSWSKSTDEDDNLEGYIVERSYNGGSSWSQIYQGTATSTSTTIPFGTNTVMFRVCAYDTEGEKSGWRTSSNKTVVNNRAPGVPPSISVPLAPSGGEALTVTWTAASDADGNLEGYELERQWDGTGAFTQLYKGAALSYRDSIPKGEHTSVVYRVRAYDAMGAKSSYTTSPSRTIENNTAPVITSDLSGDLGVKSDGFTIPYTITDAEQQAVTVIEAVGSLIKRSYQPTLGEQNTFEVTGEYFQKILNGANTVTITAQDTGGKSSVLSLTFTKKVHKAVITLTEPLPSEQQIEVCVLSITGEIPADADCLIEVTNNGADEEPVWEDATADVKAGRNHVFANKTQTNGWAFNFRVTAERGQDGESENGGYIMSIQGGFQ